MYKDVKDKIVSVKKINGIEKSEIEDLIPFEFIAKPVEKLLGVQDEDDEFEPQKGQPVIPQIEKYAQERGIELETGWKAIVAKSFKKTLFGKKQKVVPEEYEKLWISLFERISEV